MNRDLAYLSRVYEEDVPKDKAYLYKYFKTDVQQAFIKYVQVFGEYTHFMEHTGHRCSMRWLDGLYARLLKLEALQRKAKQDMDFQLLARIEAGRYKITRESSEFERREDEQEEET